MLVIHNRLPHQLPGHQPCLLKLHQAVKVVALVLCTVLGRDVNGNAARVLARQHVSLDVVHSLVRLLADAFTSADVTEKIF